MKIILISFISFISLICGNLSVSDAELNEFNEFVIDNSAMFECFKQYDDLNNGFIQELVEDDVWFTNIFNNDSSFDICSKIELIWDDINEYLYDNLNDIIALEAYDEYDEYGINIDIIFEILTFFGVHDYLLDDDVRMDIAFHALRWLTKRKEIYREVSIFCNNNNNNDRLNILQGALLNITQKCILNAANVSVLNSRSLLDRDRDRNDTESGIISDVADFCNNLLETNKDFGLEISIQIGMILHFQAGLGIYGKLSVVTDIYVYRTFGLGILLNAELGIWMSYIDYKYPYNGDDYIDAKGKWTLGIQSGVGFAYSWIKNKHRSTIANSYSFAVGIGFQLADYIWFIGNENIKRIELFNLSALCNKVAKLDNITLSISILDDSTETPNDTISQPPRGTEIDLFSDDYVNWWTPINGAWSNFTGIFRQNSISINDNNNGELNTNWIGNKYPQTLEWENYTVSVDIKISDTNIDGSSSVGFIFGVQENVNEAYYFGINYETAIFGIFDSNGIFSLIETLSIAINLDDPFTLSATFVNNNDNTADITLVFGNAQFTPYIAQQFLRGSVGMRTIGKNGQYSSFNIIF